MASQEPSKRQKLMATRRTVHFTPECKQFDGLSPRSCRLQHLVQRLFFHRIAVSEAYVVELVQKDAKQALDLLEDFHGLVCRMRHGICEENQQSFLLLNKGGGDNLRLSKDHFPFCILLGRVVESAYKHLSAASSPLDVTISPARKASSPSRVSSAMLVPKPIEL